MTTPIKVPLANGTSLDVVAFYHPGTDKAWDTECKAGYMGNFWKEDFTFNGHVFHTSEAAYQASKFWHHPGALVDFSRAVDGDAAFRIARVLKGTLSNTQQKHVKLQLADPCHGFNHCNYVAMTEILKAKFGQSPRLKRELISTGDAYLLEHNDSSKEPTWSDNYDGEGLNLLGYALMDVRKWFTGTPGSHGVRWNNGTPTVDQTLVRQLAHFLQTRYSGQKNITAAPLQGGGSGTVPCAANRKCLHGGRNLIPWAAFGGDPSKYCTRSCRSWHDQYGDVAPCVRGEDCIYVTGASLAQVRPSYNGAAGEYCSRRCKRSDPLASAPPPPPPPPPAQVPCVANARCLYVDENLVPRPSFDGNPASYCGRSCKKWHEVHGNKARCFAGIECVRKTGQTMSTVPAAWNGKPGDFCCMTCRRVYTQKKH